MSVALLRLSAQLHDAIPQLMLFAIFRKATASMTVAVLRMFKCLPLGKKANAFFDAYDKIDRMINTAWAHAYVFVLLYAAYDILTNLSDFQNCKQHQHARPIGIFCAIALSTFVFTTKLSASSLSLVVLLFAEQQNVLTGMAATICVAMWANSSGSSVLLGVVILLSGAHWTLCSYSSSALLCLVGCSWISVWFASELTHLVLRLIMNGPKVE
jgi:hypothetical protein